MIISRIVALLFAIALPFGAAAQSSNVALGGLAVNGAAPIEVSADELTVDPDSGNAVFTGNVVVVQGDMRLAATTITVEYETDDSGNRTPSIGRVIASGGVTFVSGQDAAEAQEGVYSVSDASLVLTGDVLVTQGPNTVAGDRLFVDLEAGTGRMEGQVRTILQTGEN